MTELNPLVEATENGTVYTHSERDVEPYILVRISPDESNDELFGISLDSEGLDSVQTLHILEALTEQLRSEIDTQQPPRRKAGF